MKSLLAGLLSFAVLAAGDTPARETPPAAGNRSYWVLMDSELDSLVKAGLSRDLLSYFFNTPRTLIIEPTGRNISPLVAELPSASRVETFDSAAALADAVNHGALYPNIRYVAFNAHFWVWKDTTEQRNLMRTAGATAALAHRHGLKFFFAIPAIIAPHLNTTPSGDKFTDYLREDLAGQGAALADVFEIESQDLQKDPTAFDTFAGQALVQARSANPRIPVLLGLTTYARGLAYSARSLEDAYAATRTKADGYWINGVNNGASQEAVSFLRHLYAELRHQ